MGEHAGPPPTRPVISWRGCPCSSILCDQTAQVTPRSLVSPLHVALQFLSSTNNKGTRTQTSARAPGRWRRGPGGRLYGERAFSCFRTPHGVLGGDIAADDAQKKEIWGCHAALGSYAGVLAHL